MKLLIALEVHFFQTSDNAIWCNGVVDYAFWSNYLLVFDEIIVAARVRLVEEYDPSWVRSDGDKVTFTKLPEYLGPIQYFKSYYTISKLLRQAITNCDCILLRVPGAIGALTWRLGRNQSKTCALEVVGDPWEALAPGLVDSIWRPIARIKGYLDLRRSCRQADAVSYVTKNFIQKRYPTGGHAYSTDYSDVNLPDDAYVLNLPEIVHKVSYTLIHIGTMDTNYKAQDIILKALKVCRDSGLDVKLTFIGGGRNLHQYKELTNDLALSEWVSFKGYISNTITIREELDGADIFLLPSLSEGQPRALLEAMARGLPCIASNVGGIPEVLDEQDLIIPNDYHELANKIIMVLSNPNRMRLMSERNYTVAKEYRLEKMVERRVEFYRTINNIAKGRL